jgi:hypothetical protein
MINVHKLDTRYIDAEPIHYNWWESRKWEFWDAEECDHYDYEPDEGEEEPEAEFVLNNHECDVCGTEIFSDGPMMNYAYPIDLRHVHENVEIAAYRLVYLPLCLVSIQGMETYHLALTGGGMDFSWEICRAYIEMGFLPPTWFARLPDMSKWMTKDNAYTIAACRRSLKVAHERAYHQYLWGIADLRTVARRMVERTRRYEQEKQTQNHPDRS